MDYNMPFMDGCETTQGIRQYLYDKNIYQPIIVALTGQTTEDHVKACLKSGTNQVSSKPMKTSTYRVILKYLQLVH
jgi:CheY-like chemotaxis protein